MSDTTTIQIRAEQKAALNDLKASDGEPYHEVLQRLIENHNEAADLTESEVRDLARDVVVDMVVGEALR